MTYEVSLISDFIPPISTRFVYVDVEAPDAAKAAALVEYPGWIVTNTVLVKRVALVDPPFAYGRQMVLEYGHGGTRRVSYDAELIERLVSV